MNSLIPASITSLANCTPLQIRYLICALEAEMREALARGELTEREFPLIHSFSEGKYTRSIFLPAGSVLVGKLHKHAHPNSILQGKVTVVTEHGGLETLTAPCHMTSPAATKRAIYVHEDTIWTVEHETSSTNLEEIESQVIAKSFSQLGLEDPVEQLQLTIAHCAVEN